MTVKYMQFRKALTENFVLELARNFYKQHGSWPVVKSGLIEGESLTWSQINSALIAGNRGLAGGSHSRKPSFREWLTQLSHA